MFIRENLSAAVQTAAVVDQAVVYGSEHIDIQIF